MQRLVLGALDSRVELEALAERISRQPGNRDRFAYFVADLHLLWKHGHPNEGRKWLDTARPELKVYTGRRDEPTSGGIRIWAAVEIRQGQLEALIKTSDGYAGDAGDYADRLAEALDRLLRGAKAPW